MQKSLVSAALVCAALSITFMATSCAKTSSIKQIGVVQLVEHQALDASYRGFIDGLKAAGYEDGKNIKIDFQNAQGEQANCVTIADKLVNERCDLILAIATPAAQAVANLTKKIPILVTAVTDPESAKLVASNKAPGGNVSGTSDLNPIEAQIQLVKRLVPKATTIAFLYNSSEQNSKFQVDLAKTAAAKLGLSFTDATVSSSNELQQVAQSLVGKVQAVYVPTDNMIAAGMPTVAAVLTPAKIPVICGESGMVAAGGLATYGIDYYELGKQTAAMAVEVLKDGKNPGDMPIQYQSNLAFSVNEDQAKKLGISIPADLLAKIKK